MMIPWVHEYLRYLLETCCQRLCQVEDPGQSFAWGFFSLGGSCSSPKARQLLGRIALWLGGGATCSEEDSQGVRVYGMPSKRKFLKYNVSEKW